jgi:hypothetical protein
LDDQSSLNDSSGIEQTFSISSSSTRNYTFSVFAKQGTAEYFDIYSFFLTTVKGSYVRYTWATDQFAEGSADGGGVVPTNIVKTSFGNGWYRFSFTVNDANDGNNTSLSYRLYPSGRDPDKTGTTIFYGNQVEFGSAVTNYIPTTSNQVTVSDCKGLLIEEGRRNLYARSAEFESTFWTKTRSSITENATTAPDGTLTADKLVEDATASNTHTVGSTVTPPQFIHHILSVFAKKGERNFIVLRLGGVNDFFNLDTGTAITNVNAPTITNFGDGWYRCTVRSAQGTQGNFQMSADGITTSYTGDGTSGIFIWGAQLEAGSFATSYIPTTTSARLRTADVCVISGADFGTIYNSGEGTLVVNAAANALSGNNIYFPSIYNSTTPVIGSYFRSDQQYRLTSNVSSVLLTPDTNYNTAGVFYSVAIAADRNGADYVINGNQIADSYTGSTYLADSLQMALSGSTVINEVKYYRKRLSVDQQINLTT